MEDAGIDCPCYASRIDPVVLVVPFVLNREQACDDPIGWWRVHFPKPDPAVGKRLLGQKPSVSVFKDWGRRRGYQADAWQDGGHECDDQYRCGRHEHEGDQSMRFPPRGPCYNTCTVPRSHLPG